MKKCICINNYDDGSYYVFKIGNIYDYRIIVENFVNINIEVEVKTNITITLSPKRFNYYFSDLAEQRDMRINDIFED